MLREKEDKIKVPVKSMTVPNKDILEYVSNNYPDNCREIMDRLQISYNSMRKIQRGEPIRSSLAERVASRFSEIQRGN